MRVPRIVLVAGMEPSAFTCTPASMLEVRGRERDEEKTTRSRNLSEEKLSSRSNSLHCASLARSPPDDTSMRLSMRLCTRQHLHLPRAVPRRVTTPLGSISFLPPSRPLHTVPTPPVIPIDSHPKHLEPIHTSLRGRALLNDPSLNRGAAFTRAEREEFGLEGLLPYEIHDMELQCSRAYLQFKSRSESDMFVRYGGGGVGS